VPFSRIEQPPAARTLRAQSEVLPNVSGMTAVSPVTCAPTIATYDRPDRLPVCVSRAAPPKCLRPATAAMTGFSAFVIGRMTTRTSQDGLTGSSRPAPAPATGG
jgi:hypothetical protein